MLIRQSSFHGGEVDPQLFSRTDIPSRKFAVRSLRNFIPLATGAALNRPGFKYIAPLKDQTRRGRLVSFTFSTDQSYLLEFGHLYVRVYQGGVFVVDVVTTYTEAELPRLQFGQYADTLTIAHPSHALAELKRTGVSTWTLASVSVTRATPTPTGLLITAQTPVANADDTHAAKIWEYVVTAVPFDTGVESMPQISGGTTGFSGATGIPTNNMLVYPDRPVSLSWDAVTSLPIGSMYFVYRGRNGIWGYVGSVQTTAANGVPAGFVDEGQVPNYSDAPPRGISPFVSPENPAVVTYFQSRLLLANQPSFPQRILASKTEHFKDFDYSLPQKKNDALDFTVVSRQFEEIRGLVGMQQLVVLTANTEFIIDSGNNPISPDAFSVIPVGHTGSSWVQPLTVDDSVLFVPPSKAAVREMVYGGINGWAGSEVSLAAGHLLSANDFTIDEWAVQKSPFSLCWIVRNDGALLSLTYNPQLKVYAWAHHDSDGDSFESVASIPEGTEDALYAIVRRTVDGSTVRYIERLERRTALTLASAGNFLDASVRSSGQVITGLGHLNGRTVYALRDGTPEGPFVVSGGSVTLSASGTTVFVGLWTPMDIELLDLSIDPGDGRGDIGPDQKLVSHTIFEVDRTAGLQAGEDFSSLTPWRAPLGWSMPASGVAHDLFVVPIDSSWNRGGKAVLRQTQPLPISVLGVSRDLAVGGI